MMQIPIQQKKIGLLGGGQLGRMLIQSATDLNLDVSILDPDMQAPCRYLVKNFTQGSLTDFDTVYHFGADKDLITIEIENVNTEALKKLESEGKQVYPQPHIIELIQDKGLQKNFFKEHGIATAEFFLVENKAQITEFRNEFPFFQKLRKGGYDGKGVCKLNDPDNLKKAFDAPSVLERLVDYEKELSVIVARNESGQTKSFPVVECKFSADAHLVEYLFCPADISAEVERKAVELANKVSEKLGIVGLLAVELFLTRDGAVLVNEIAPRPHNSGHHTIEANITSQFEQHLRAVLNLPLGDTAIIRAGVMLNLLGEAGHSGPAIYKGLEQTVQISGVYLHLYGKSITKPNRKMGHITIVDKDISVAREKAELVKNTLKVTS
jgi:5-(carboxyamino)imidazole ribonucleotide synthase